MGKVSLLKLSALGALQVSTVVLAREPPFRVDIGHFSFPLNDPEIQSRVRQTMKNLTIWENIRTFTHKYHDSKNQANPDDVEKDAIRQFANDSKIDNKELEVLLERARKSYDTQLVDYGNDSQRLWKEKKSDLSAKFLDEIEGEFKNLHHQQLAAFAGVGSKLDCSLHIGAMLDQMTEWEKSGMAAATTLMALLPTFLAFGNLFVPRSSEAFATSWLIGLGAALFSLGLPVRSLSCVRRKQVVELGTLDKDPLDDIADLGERNPDPSDGDAKATLEELQQWTKPKPPHRYMREFARIRKQVDEYGERWHWWHVPAALIAACQAVIFALAVEPLLKAGGIPRFIFACADTNWTGLYLAVSAATNALFRLALWQLCDHEVVSIYHLSDEAKSKLEALKKPDPEGQLRTTETQIPPLYPPVVSKFHRMRGKLIQKVFKSYKPIKKEHPSGALSRPIRDQFDYLKSVFKDPMSIIRSGFADTDAAPRWRPLVVLIHLSTTGRPQMRTLWTGFCEAALLLILTFFFASQWGGNLYITCVALGLLLVFITVGRALAIVYVWLSAGTWGLHTINCDEQVEILGCLRIICSMQGVLVVVNGAYYYDGYRLDYQPEFKLWRKQYASGAFDRKSCCAACVEKSEKKKRAGSVEPKKNQSTVTTTSVGHDQV